MSVVLTFPHKRLEKIPPKDRFENDNVKEPVSNSSEWNWDHTFPSLNIPSYRDLNLTRYEETEKSSLESLKTYLYIGLSVIITILLLEFVWTFDMFRDRKKVKKKLTCIITVILITSILFLLLN